MDMLPAATARWRLDLCFDGTRYHGWQRQPNAISVQQTTEEALSTILQQPVSITGAGRTDTGVHARLMPTHFDSNINMSAEQLAYKLNRILPDDIAALQAQQVSDQWHARFSATQRTYHYYVHLGKKPFLRYTSLQLHHPLDMNAMNEAAATLLETHDFAAFCKSGSDVRTTLCDVKEAKWINTGNKTWYFRISADRFLRNMVRAIVGTLVDVGRGKTTLQQFNDIINGHQRTQAGDSMPAHALCLESVDYPQT